MTIGKSLRADGVDRSCPMPGSPKSVSVMNAPPSRSAEVETEHRHDRGEGSAQPVLEDHAALRHALRARRADVVLAHRLDQVAAHHARVEGRGRHRERDPGQDELALRDRLPDVVAADLQPGATGNHPSLNQKKYRSSCPSQKTGIETPMSAKNMPRGRERSSLDAREDADRDAEEEPEDRGADRERDRDGQPPADLLLDRHEVRRTSNTRLR